MRFLLIEVFDMKRILWGEDIRRRRAWFGLIGFLTSSSATRLIRRRVPRLTSDNFTCYHKETERGGHDLSLSRSHYINTDPTSRERRGDRTHNPDQESHALPPELHPLPPIEREWKQQNYHEQQTKNSSPSHTHNSNP